MRRVLLALLLAAPLPAQEAAERAGLVPRPMDVRDARGEFRLTSRTMIQAEAPFTDVARRFAAELRRVTGLPLQTATNGMTSGNITLRADTTLGAEAYTLDVTTERVRIAAGGPAGAFYALQTLQQLMPPAVYSGADAPKTWTVKAITVRDQPRFTWRGAHLDVARHFRPAEDVKRFLDAMARHKLNRFHWHLVDDQGWRLPIVKYPKLTEVGGCRAQTMVGRYVDDPAKRVFDGRRYCGAYTTAEIREIVQYAAERFITVVPEIEMPGHAQAAVSAYPQLGIRPDTVLTPMEIWGVSPWLFNAEPATIAVLQDVLTEVLALFPSPWIHVGGDEAEKTLWKTSPLIQARIRTLGLKDEHELQSWFIRQMDEWLVARGRRLIGWDEILEGGLAPNATVMSWRGTAGGIAAAKAGHDVVMTPTSHTYFDYYQSEDRAKEPLAIGGFLPLRKVYDYEPVPSELAEAEAPRVLGTQGQLWTEYLPTREAVEYMAWPRLAALAEVAWTPAMLKDWVKFRARMDVHAGRLAAMGVRFRPLDP